MSLTADRNAAASSSDDVSLADDLARRATEASKSRWRASLGARIAGLCAQAMGPCERGTAILTYHRIAEPLPGDDHPFDACAGNVTPETFEAQLRGLSERGYRPRSLTDLLADANSLEERFSEASSERSFVVTFDDGYENFFENAYPILKRLRIPATLFVATAYLDREAPFPFDLWSGAGMTPAIAWRPLRSEQLRMLAADPSIRIGTHTHTHDDFRDRFDEFARDMRQSIDLLAERFGLEAPLPFAFPYGVTSLGFAGGELTERARRLPVSCALSTEPRLAADRDPFAWGRFDVKQTDDAATLAGKLDGWFTRLKRWTGKDVD